MTTFYVDAGGANGAEKTINAALGKAAAGDTITVHDGTYKETVNLSKPGVTLRAANSRKAVIDGGYGPGKFKADNTLPPVDSAKQYSPLVKLSGAGSVVAGFVIRNSPGRGAQLVADGAQLIDCHVDFCYSHTVWVGDCADALVGECIVTRGSLRAFDPTRGYGGTPMGVDTCLALVRAVNPAVYDTVIAFNYGEGLGLTKNTTGATIVWVTAFANLHDNIYISGGGTGAEITDCVAFQPPDTEAMMKLCGLNQYGNVTLGDEEQDQQSGPGLFIRNCLFLPSVNGRPFTIDGWNGSGNFPRPFVLDGAYIANNTIVAGPLNTGLALFSSSTHRAHKNSLVENNVLLAATTAGIAAPSYGAGHGDVVYRNNLSNRLFPAAIAGKDSVTTTAPILVNPFAEIAVVTPFDVRSSELPDVCTTYDPANYRPVAGSPALGMASDGGAVNGITPPLPQSTHVGAFVYDEPEPEPEPPAWGQALVNLSAALQAAYAAHEAAHEAIDAADDKLALAGECFVELVNRLNEG
jgi:hypothetical protein